MCVCISVCISVCVCALGGGGAGDPGCHGGRCSSLTFLSPGSRNSSYSHSENSSSKLFLSFLFSLCWKYLHHICTLVIMAVGQWPPRYPKGTITGLQTHNQHHNELKLTQTPSLFFRKVETILATVCFFYIKCLFDPILAETHSSMGPWKSKPHGGC